MYCVDCIVMLAFQRSLVRRFSVDCRFVTEYYVIRMIIFFVRFVYFDTIDENTTSRKKDTLNKKSGLLFGGVSFRVNKSEYVLP